MENSEVKVPGSVQMDGEVSLIDVAIIIAKHKKLIIRNTIAAAILGVAISFVIPKSYTATATILPPEQSHSAASAMLGQLGALAGMAGGSIGIKNSAELYITMLKSRDIEADLVQRFSLKAYYKTTSNEKARKALEKNMLASYGKKDGIISIEFSNSDPKRAADIANAYVEELNKLTSTLAITEASQRRLFFQKQLSLVRDKLAKAEFDLQKIQQKSGLISDYPQAKEIAESNARLRAEIAAKEVQLSSMQIGVTRRNPEFLRIQGELASLKDRLKGAGSGDMANSGMTENGIDYFRKFREVKFNEALMEMLYKQFEAAKIDEAKDYPLIQVLDKAVAPEFKSKPKRAIVVIIFTLASCFLSLIWIFFREWLETAKLNPKQAEKIGMLKAYVSLGKS